MILLQLSYSFASGGPKKPLPEIVPPPHDVDRPEAMPEIPVLPKVPESERPAGGAEVGPPDGGEIPEMPRAPEVGIPAQELPRGMLH